MDTTETHYLTFDAEAIYTEMLAAYMEAGGDVLYPGDEKEILLRAVQAIMIQAFAVVDNALRMMTLRYAVGDYLDLIGELRGCNRIEAKTAAAKVSIHYVDQSVPARIPAGTQVTFDGKQIYRLKNDVIFNGYTGIGIRFSEAEIVAEEAGASGNSLSAGMHVQFLQNIDNIEKVYCSQSAKGGADRETDDSYRERIREYGSGENTTGTAEQYEAAAKAVTVEVLDAKAINKGAGKVSVILAIDDDTSLNHQLEIIQKVTDALNTKTGRPLTDQLSVGVAQVKKYTLDVQYKTTAGADIASAVAEAKDTYQKWQDNEVGKAFDPYYLVSLLYRAGAIQVQFAEGSNFDGGPVEYTEIPEDRRCDGTITLTMIPEN